MTADGLTDCSRAEAIKILEAGDRHLHALLDRLTPEETCTASTIAGSEWSAKDLLGHIAFWEERAVAAIDDWRGGRTLISGDADQLNAENHLRSAGQPLAAIHERATLAHQNLIAAIRALSEADWVEGVDVDGRDFSLGGRIGAITGGPKGAFNHVDAHLSELEAYLGKVRNA